MRALLVLMLVTTTAHAGVLTVGQPAVELDIAVDAAGKPFKLAAFRGRWLVLAIGAAWCVPCNDELPVWNKLAGELAGRVTFVSLSFDNDIADGKAFHERLGVPNLLRAYLPEESSKIAERYGAVKMPVTFVIGPDGTVRHVQFGFEKAHAQREYDQLKSALVTRLPPKAALVKVLPAKPNPKPTPRPAPTPNPTPQPEPSPTPAPTGLSWVLPDPPHPSWWAAHWALRF